MLTRNIIVALLEVQHFRIMSHKVAPDGQMRRRYHRDDDLCEAQLASSIRIRGGLRFLFNV